jgi:MinD-like ATPase involved in chromosome partitioning or flagellar assembly
VTLISVFSLKGAPGVTTLSCLLASAWPAQGPLTVVEADPSGGDLAARFGLSSRTGWTSLCSSTRRSEESPSLTPHLQMLPGGLGVLVGARGEDRRSARSDEGTTVRSAPDAGGPGSAGLTIVDLGRLAESDTISDSWLGDSDASIVVVPGEAPAAMQLRNRGQHLLDTCNGRLVVIAVGGGRTGRELAEFAGIPVLDDVPVDVPVDGPAAAVASGASGAHRRLERSLLWVAAGRTAAAVADRIESGWEDGRQLMALRPGAATPSDPPPVRRWKAGLRRSSVQIRDRVTVSDDRAVSGHRAADAGSEPTDHRRRADA